MSAPTFIDPTTGLAIGYRATKGTTAEPFLVPMAWQSSTLSYVALAVDGSGNLLTVGAGGGGGAVTVADGADVTQGALADAAVTTDVAGSLSAKLRGLVKMFAAGTAHVTVDAAPAVTGTVTANAGTNLNTSLLALEAGGNLATIAAKDFATQTTLALVKAKTDNLDVALSTRVAEATFTTRIPVQGQAAMAASVPVVVASNQSAIPMSAASLPLPANAAQETGGNLAALVALFPALQNDSESFTGRYERQTQELMLIETNDLGSYDFVRRANERVTLTERRGSVGRGSTR